MTDPQIRALEEKVAEKLGVGERVVINTRRNEPVFWGSQVECERHAAEDSDYAVKWYDVPRLSESAFDLVVEALADRRRMIAYYRHAPDAWLAWLPENGWSEDTTEVVPLIDDFTASKPDGIGETRRLAVLAAVAEMEDV